MSYVLDGVEAPTLHSLDLALARREARKHTGLGATSPLARAQSLLLDLVKKHKAGVRKYLKKYGSTPRLRDKGTTIRELGKDFDFSARAVDKADDFQLAALLATAFVHDKLHALFIAGQMATGLGTLGESDGEGIPPEAIKAAIDIVVAIGPSVAELIGQLFKSSEAKKETPKAKTHAASVMPKKKSTSTVLVPVEPMVQASSSKLPLVLLGIGALGAVWWFFLRKK